MSFMSLVGVVILAASVGYAQTPAPASASAPAVVAAPAQPAAGTTIVGLWMLNPNQSDKPQDNGGGGGRGQGGRGGGRGGGGRGGGGFSGGFGGGGRRGGGGGGGGQPQDSEEQQRKRQALRDILEAPDKMTITQTESMVIITTGDGRTTRLSTDGKKIKDESTGIERKTHWQNGSLVSEITGAGNSGKITETYAVNAELHQLTVTVAVSGNDNNERPPMHRVYDFTAN